MDKKELCALLESGAFGSVWSREQIDRGIKAHFRCTYCDRDLLASVNDYVAWQVDHVIPRSRHVGNPDVPENKVICCRTCNFLKGKWNPIDEAGVEADLEQLVLAARRHVQRKRSEKLLEVAKVRDAVRKVVDL